MKKGLTYGATHAIVKPQATQHHPKGGEQMASDHPSKTRWEKENIVHLTIKINRNQDPELYELFTREQGSKGALAKKLLRAGLTNQQQEK